MGYFRRFKLNKYTASQCRKECKWIERRLTRADLNIDLVRHLVDRWACFRELLARHEKDNQGREEE